MTASLWSRAWFDSITTSRPKKDTTDHRKRSPILVQNDSKLCHKSFPAAADCIWEEISDVVTVFFPVLPVPVTSLHQMQQITVQMIIMLATQVGEWLLSNFWTSRRLSERLTQTMMWRRKAPKRDRLIQIPLFSFTIRSNHQIVENI